MTSIVTSKFRVHNAEQFVEAFSETSNSIMYLFVGKPTAFTDDNNPPTPVNSTANNEFAPWREMYGAKRISASDVSHAVPRYDWTTGTVYTQYDDQATNLLDDDFYVMTDEYNVYKCLFNNGGGNSTEKPTGTGLVPFTLGDGYTWKYLYTVSTAKALKFVTTDYIPVETLTSDDGSAQWDVQQAAIAGGIHIVKVGSGGSGYYSGNTTVTISGDGTGATANVTTSAEPGAITKITITNPGTGYTTATVSISGDGSSASANAIISPSGGHGSNPVEELGGKYVMLNVRLDGNEANTISTGNEFRQVGILRDPYDYGTSTRSVSSTIRQSYKYELTGVSGAFVADETVTSGSNTAYVVEWDATGEILYTTLPLNLEFANGASVAGASATGTISVITNPGFEPYSGDLLYVENRVPIARADDQVEDIKLIIQF